VGPLGVEAVGAPVVGGHFSSYEGYVIVAGGGMRTRSSSVIGGGEVQDSSASARRTRSRSTIGDRWAAWLDRDDPTELLMPDDDLVEALELRPIGKAIGNVRNTTTALLDRVAV
jgi:hypothetical protein